MFISTRFLDLFKVTQSVVDTMREELATTKIERDLLKTELITARISSDWMRAQINTLQMERATLMEKIYGVRVPVPQLVRTSVLDPQLPKIEDTSFDDMGDEMAKRFGLPLYGDKLERPIS